MLLSIRHLAVVVVKESNAAIGMSPEELSALPLMHALALPPTNTHAVAKTVADGKVIVPNGPVPPLADTEPH